VTSDMLATGNAVSVVCYRK